MSAKIDLLLEMFREHKHDIKEDLEEIKHDLAEHMRRTDQNEQMIRSLHDAHQDNKVRIEAIEAPKKARAYLKGMLLEIGKFGGVVLTVAGVLRFLGKI